MPIDGTLSTKEFDALLAEQMKETRADFGTHAYGVWNRQYALKKRFAQSAYRVFRDEINSHLSPKNPVILLDNIELTTHGGSIGFKSLYPPRKAHAR